VRKKRLFEKLRDMAENLLVDAGFLVALLSRRDSHHRGQ
jgi:hypothetical protein